MSSISSQTYTLAYQVDKALKLVLKYRMVLALFMQPAIVKKRFAMLFLTCAVMNRVGRIFGFFVIKFARVKY